MLTSPYERQLSDTEAGFDVFTCGASVVMLAVHSDIMTHKYSVW
jgi:hypothetical protein